MHPLCRDKYTRSKYLDWIIAIPVDSLKVRLSKLRVVSVNVYVAISARRGCNRASHLFCRMQRVEKIMTIIFLKLSIFADASDLSKDFEFL